MDLALLEISTPSMKGDLEHAFRLEWDGKTLETTCGNFTYKKW
jgi:hypothetical protein